MKSMRDIAHFAINLIMSGCGDSHNNSHNISYFGPDDVLGQMAKMYS